jgi:lipopolysaccharide/colanic/teichoic acid biosynthesis glycosyltransferase/ubiquinone/menaquinone biosynthesis C-methylase UbiE
MKRLFDIVFSVLGLIATGPVLVLSMLAIWLQDRHSPFYIAPRVGKGGEVFKMVKLRSMTVNADRSGIDSTSASDPRITPVGKFVRAYKLDELSQLWNVLKGDMSFVGPRPNVQRETDIYTPVERRLLSIRPGITDIASIVFSDENAILRDSEDPDIEYNQLIRPWKSRLGLLYVDNRSLILDIRLIFLTAIAVVSRERALKGVQKVLDSLGADEVVKQVAKRKGELKPFPPPGATGVVTSRELAQQSSSNQIVPIDYSSVTELPGSGATCEQLERLYHRYHAARQRAAGKRVLEVACGAGMGLGYLADTASKVIGGDYTENLLRTAWAYYQDRIPLLRLDAHHLPFSERSFDLAIIFEAIYYLADPPQFLAEVRRVLDTNGAVLIGTVNKDWSEFAPSPFSTGYFSVPELRDLLNQGGFTNLEFYGAFPTEGKSFKHMIVSLIRRLVVALDLMPKTLEGRARLKRIFYGDLIPIPPEVSEGMAELYPLEPIAADVSTDKYKIIYCTASCP